MSSESELRLGSQEVVVTEENLGEILSGIARKREIPGQSNELLPYIRMVREQVDNTGDMSSVVQLFQEEFLVGQHIVMEEKAKGAKLNPARVIKGVATMLFSQRGMMNVINKHEDNIDPARIALSHRYIGRFADHMGWHKVAEKQYREGLSYFDEKGIDQSHIRLEFMGFISNALFGQGNIEAGRKMAVSTLREFDNSEDGIRLKNNDYYTWAVWKSGIAIRTAEHLLNTSTKENIALARELLDDTGIILGDDEEIFGFRLAELRWVREIKNI